MQDGWTPLHVAVQSRNRDIAKILLVNGADQTRRTNVWTFGQCFEPLIIASYALGSYFVYIVMPLYIAHSFPMVALKNLYSLTLDALDF
jgi:ankyrin repeat protein